jgi:hypothetical protein
MGLGMTTVLAPQASAQTQTQPQQQPQQQQQSQQQQNSQGSANKQANGSKARGAAGGAAIGAATGDAAYDLQRILPIAGLTPQELENFRLVEAQPAAASQGKRILEFTADQVPRARLIKQLVRKGVTYGHLARTNLAFDPSQAFVVYDGQELRPCRDADAAIAAVVRAKRWCSAIDLNTIRTSATE